MTDAPIADTAAERALVQCIIAWPETLAKLPKSFRPSYAFDDAHRTALDEIFRLHRDGKNADVVLLLARLRDRPAFRGGSAGEYLADVAQPGPLPSNAPEYARRIEELYHKRTLGQMMADGSRHLLNGTPPREGLANLLSDLTEYSRNFESEELTADKLLDLTFESIAARERPDVIVAGSWMNNLSRLPLQRKGITTIGGQTGSGKTAAAIQVLVDAMRVEEQLSLRLFIANVEMPPERIIERQLSRLAGVDHTALQRRTYHDHQLPSIEAARDELRPVLQRTRFMPPPFTISGFVAGAKEFDSDLVCCDYVQRFSADAVTDQRTQVNRAMDACRELASQGRAVVVLSALNRPSGGGDWTRDTIGLGAFRESSEVEYSSDNVFGLVRERGARSATLVNLKNRSGQLDDIELEFEGCFQRFVNAPVADFPEFRS